MPQVEAATDVAAGSTMSCAMQEPYMPCLMAAPSSIMAVTLRVALRNNTATAGFTSMRKRLAAVRF